MLPKPGQVKENSGHSLDTEQFCSYIHDGAFYGENPMKKHAKFFIIFFLPFFSSCAIQKGLSPAGAPEARSFDLSLKQGLLFFERGEYAKAAEQFRAATASNPDSAKAHNYLGICYFQLKNYEPARGQFEKAAALDPSFASAYNNLGGIYAIKLEFEKAKEMFKKALSLAPNLVSANYSLGMLLFSLGENEEASAYLSRAIALDPDYLEKHKDLVATFSSVQFDMTEMFFTCAKLYASRDNIEKTVAYLQKAKQAGFRDWERILREKEFEKVRDDPRIKVFLISTY
jgi:tetratricopeptide (TPR) repeat protein